MNVHSSDSFKLKIKNLINDTKTKNKDKNNYLNLNTDENFTQKKEQERTNSYILVSDFLNRRNTIKENHEKIRKNSLFEKFAAIQKEMNIKLQTRKSLKLKDLIIDKINNNKCNKYDSFIEADGNNFSKKIAPRRKTSKFTNLPKNQEYFIQFIERNKKNKSNFQTESEVDNKIIDNIIIVSPASSSNISDISSNIKNNAIQRNSNKKLSHTSKKRIKNSIKSDSHSVSNTNQDINSDEKLISYYNDKLLKNFELNNINKASEFPKLEKNNLSKLKNKDKLQNKIENNRIIKKYQNIYDSYSENDDLTEDYFPRKYSIHPSSSFILFWNNIISLYYIFLIFYNSLLFCFDNLRTKSFIDVLLNNFLFCDCIIILNIIITLFTGILKDNHMSYSIKYIYSQKSFEIFIQIISCLPFSIIKLLLILKNIPTNDNYILNNLLYAPKYILLLLFIKWINLSYIFEQNSSLLEYIIPYLKQNEYLLSIINFIGKLKGFLSMVLIFFLITHLGCTIMIFLAYSNEYSEDLNWIKVQKLENKEYLDIYISCFYFIMSTFITVGYGDIIASNQHERIFCIFLLMIGCFFYSYVITTISSIFKNHNKYLEIYHDKIKVLNDIKKIYQVKDSLYKIIQRYLFFNYEKGAIEKHEFLESLPNIIKNELTYKMYSKRILKLDFFSNILKSKELISSLHTIINSTMNSNKIRNNINSEEFLLFIVPLLNRNIYHKSEQVWAFNQLINEMFMIGFGKVNLSIGYEYQNYVIGSLGKNKHYGEIVMFDENQTSSLDIVVSSKIAEIFTLGQREFHMINEAFPNIVEKILKKGIKNHLEIETLRTIAIEFYNINLTFKGFKDLIREITYEEISNFFFHLDLKNSNNDVMEKYHKFSDDNNANYYLPKKEFKITLQKESKSKESIKSDNNKMLSKIIEEYDINETSILKYNKTFKTESNDFKNEKTISLKSPTINHKKSSIIENIDVIKIDEESENGEDIIKNVYNNSKKSFFISRGNTSQNFSKNKRSLSFLSNGISKHSGNDEVIIDFNGVNMKNNFYFPENKRFSKESIIINKKRKIKEVINFIKLKKNKIESYINIKKEYNESIINKNESIYSNYFKIQNKNFLIFRKSNQKGYLEDNELPSKINSLYFRNNQIKDKKNENNHLKEISIILIKNLKQYNKEYSKYTTIINSMNKISSKKKNSKVNINTNKKLYNTKSFILKTKNFSFNINETKSPNKSSAKKTQSLLNIKNSRNSMLINNLYKKNKEETENEKIFYSDNANNDKDVNIEKKTSSKNSFNINTKASFLFLSPIKNNNKRLSEQVNSLILLHNKINETNKEKSEIKNKTEIKNRKTHLLERTSTTRKNIQNIIKTNRKKEKNLILSINKNIENSYHLGNDKNVQVLLKDYLNTSKMNKLKEKKFNNNYNKDIDI